MCSVARSKCSQLDLRQCLCWDHLQFYTLAGLQGVLILVSREEQNSLLINQDHHMWTPPPTWSASWTIYYTLITRHQPLYCIECTYVIGFSDRWVHGNESNIVSWMEFDKRYQQVYKKPERCLLLHLVSGLRSQLIQSMHQIWQHSR